MQLCVKLDSNAKVTRKTINCTPFVILKTPPYLPPTPWIIGGIIYKHQKKYKSLT